MFYRRGAEALSFQKTVLPLRLSGSAVMACGISRFSQMENRLNALGTRQKGFLFRRFNPLELLRHVHGEPEVILIAGRHGGGDGLREGPAQAQ